jgi:hypothetical protein
VLKSLRVKTLVLSLVWKFTSFHTRDVINYMNDNKYTKEFAPFIYLVQEAPYLLTQNTNTCFVLRP